MTVVVGATVAESKVSEPEESDERTAGMVSQLDGGEDVHALEWLRAVY